MSLEICKTGIPGFDDVVGGFFRGQLILVVGNAGSGKTTFAAKFIHEGIKTFNEPGLFISTYESKEEFLGYMKRLGLDFTEFEQVGLFRYIEMLSPTASDALMELSRKLTQNALELKAKRIVIDSITPFLALNPPAEVRAILHNALKSITRTLKATLLMTAEVPIGKSEIGVGVEEFVVDGIIKLKLEVPEAGAPRRILEVIKLRGQPMGRVAYEYEIGAPYGFRVITPGIIEEFEAAIDTSKKFSTGILELDEILNGGLIEGTSTLIIGPPGSGKTIFFLTLAAENVLKGKKVYYITFEEPKQQIIETLKFLNYNPEELAKKGLHIYSINPRVITIKSLNEVVYTLCSTGRNVIIILDGVTALEREFGMEFHRAIRDIIYRAKRTGSSILLSILKASIEIPEETLLSTMADNIIEFDLRKVNGRIVRSLAILKLRMTYTPTTTFEVRLEKGRLKIIPVHT